MGFYRENFLKTDIKESRLKSTKIKGKKTKNSSLGSPFTDILTEEDDIIRVFKYVPDNEKSLIVDINSAIRHGVNMIGAKDDDEDFFHFEEGIIRSARKKDKLYAGKIYRDLVSKSWDDKVKTKKGKEIIGKKVGVKYFVRRLEYKFKNKIISYPQARDLKSGRIISMKKVKRILK